MAVLKGDTFAAALQLAASVLQSRGEVSPDVVAKVVIASYKGIELAEQHLRDEASGREGSDGPSLRRR
jgi:hypothetical protein